MVPKNMTYLLQPLDLTTMKLQVFNYRGTERKFDSQCHNNKSRLTTFRLEALHTDVMKEAYQVFDSSKIKEVILNGCIAAGITESLW